MGGPVGAHTRTVEPEQRPPPGEGNKFEQRRPAPFPLPRPRPGPDSDGVDGQGAAGTPPPSTPGRKVQPARARGRRGRGRGKVRVGGGLIPLPPARRPSGGGEPWPLKEEQVGGEEGGGGKRRPVEREELGDEGGSGGSLRVPPPSPPSSTPSPRRRGSRVPRSLLSHLKAARSKVGNKKFLFRTFGLRFGTLRLRAGGGETSRRRRAGEGRRSPDPESQAPHSRPPPRGHPVSPSKPVQGTRRGEGHGPDRAARNPG